ncbi:unnamed protein product [Bursaphelenchus okinawaensis]|uniref:DH domain-containing protein n=1 Tax=Bursaphelenchus okinawaensis TaxID=465554 RepID=A0A811JSU4_9BILA|nr:unnamed protein product [Bursaphelenchus okinawaensis]CAG9081648.1 unnamed protein product [Bursaphelenchus okinawaensis]
MSSTDTPVECLTAGYAFLPGTRDIDGRPVIFVPLRNNTVQFKVDSITSVIHFLRQCIGEEYLPKKIVFVADLRNGARSEHVRMFLKVVEESFANLTGLVLILRADKFWDRHKSVVEKGRYTFGIQVIPIDNLTKYIDKKELVKEYGGNLEYNHGEWIRTRRVFDNIFEEINHILSLFNQQCSAIRNFPLTNMRISDADNKIDSLEQYIEETVNKVQKCEMRVNQVDNTLCNNLNPDFRSAINRLHKAVEDLKRQRKEVNSLFNAKRQEAAVMVNISNIEEEIEKVNDFVLKVTIHIKPIWCDIGKDEEHAKKLLVDHLNTMKAVENVEVTYNRLEIQSNKNWSNRAQMSPIRRGTNSNVAVQFKNLQNEWKMLQSVLIDREKILVAAVEFHSKYKMFMVNFEGWNQNVGVDPATVLNAPVNILQSALDEHKRFQEKFETAYVEAFSSANELKNLLDSRRRDSNSVIATEKYVKACIAKLINKQKQLVATFTSRYETISYKYNAKMFFNECDEVINWLDEHGEPFLRRKIGIGRSLEEAKRFEKNHDDFKKISENTYLSTKKLTERSQDLIERGEIDPERARQKTEELTRRMKLFTKKLDSRTSLLYVTCNFFMHYKEIMDYYKILKQRGQVYYFVHESPKVCEESKSRLVDEINKISVAYNHIMSEAVRLKKSLDEQREMFEVNNQETVDFVTDMIERIDACNNEEKNKWPHHRLVLTLATETSYFLAESKDVITDIVDWHKDLTDISNLNETMLEHIANSQRENVNAVKRAVTKLLCKKAELVADIKNHKVNLILPSKEPVINQLDRTAKDLDDASKEVMEIVNQLSKSCVLKAKFHKFNTDKDNILNILCNFRKELINLKCNPENKQETAACKLAHERYKKRLEEINDYFVTFNESANYLKQYIVDSEQNIMWIKGIDTVTSEFARIKQLLDNRIRMIKSADDYHNCFANATPSIDLFEKQLREVLDPVQRKQTCQAELRMNPSQRREACFANKKALTSKKEKFINATNLARKCASDLLAKINTIKDTEFYGYQVPRHILELEEHAKNNKEYIFEREKNLQVLFTSCAELETGCLNAANLNLITAELDEKLSELEKKILNIKVISVDENNIKEYGQILSSCRFDLKKIQKLLKEVNKHSGLFFEQFNSSLHINEFKMAIPAINERYSRVEKSTHAKEVEMRRLSGGDSYQLLVDRNSDGSLEERLTESSECSSTFGSDVNDKLRKPYKELLDSEADYISDLGKCINCYLKSYRLSESTSPVLRQKTYEIFGNIEAIYEFHQQEFLGKLKEYETHPDDVGCCFIHYMDNLKELYTEYCLNKYENDSILETEEAKTMFQSIRECYNLPLSLDILSMLIKPVQRITRYRLLLDQVMRHSKQHTGEMKEALDVVVNIPRVANDRMHLKNFEDYQNHQIGEFILQDAFVVTEPKRVFKKEKELQVFLFESIIVFAKKEELPNRKIRYLYKYKYLTTDINVVEHVGSDGDLRFGLRKGNLPQSEAIILKTNTHENRNLWVRTLRALTLNADLISNNNIMTDNESILSRDLTSSVGRFKLSDVDSKRNSNGSITSSEMPVLMRKSPSLESPEASDVQNCNDPRSTVYSTASSDGDLPPALDHVSMVVPASEILG